MESAARVISVHVTEARRPLCLAHFMLRGAKIIRQEKQPTHPFLSSALPPAPVCLCLSVSMSSCNALMLILAVG